jgi:hypothetical protein
MTTPELQDPDDLATLDARAATTSVRNLERGQVVELVVQGLVDDQVVAALGSQLRTLAERRQPMELRLDLRSATVVGPVPVEALSSAAATLDGFGGRLVVDGADPAFEAAIPPARRGRSLVFEPDRPDAD